MFGITYLLRELRWRLGRTVLMALGLALGVGLVIGIIGVGQGLNKAQDDVLAPLSSVGTDILVTRVAGSTTAASSDATSASTSTTLANGPQAGVGLGRGGGGGGGFFAGPNTGLNAEDANALLNENRNVVTDLASLGKPGEQFTRDFFLSATLLSFPDQAVSQIAELDGVSSASGGMIQLVQHQTGTIPQIVAEIQTGGQTFTQTVRPEPMTADERTAFQQCLQSKGVTIGAPGGDGPRPQGQQGGAGGGQGTAPARNPAFDDCLPQRFQEFQAQFITPIETIRQVVNPPTTDINSASYTAGGVDPTNPEAGLVTKEQLTEGAWIAEGAADHVLLNVAYANAKSLKVGSTLPINGTDYKVVGLVKPTLTGSTADVYFPLATLQKLAGKDGRVTQVLVKAEDAESVAAVSARIKEFLPGAEVVTTKQLADQVTGSLADARKLANRLGGALAVIVLAAAFAIAVLLTLSSIGKRVREIGTLRAIGWSKARVVRQLLGETVGIGVLGGVLGIGVGALVAMAVGHFSPELSATTTGVPGLAGSSLSQFFGQATSAAQTTEVALSAPLHASTLLLGVLFALVGGVLAGLVGGWRAARLTPAVALRNLG